MRACRAAVFIVLRRLVCFQRGGWGLGDRGWGCNAEQCAACPKTLLVFALGATERAEWKRQLRASSLYDPENAMIITRSPLRISLGGGGTDLPSYYRKHSGFLIAAAIDKYVYITLHQTFVQELIVKYSRLERVGSVEEVQHPIIREALRLVEIQGPYLELTSMADIPAGTGLGSSGSFTTALLKALHTYKKNLMHPRDLAEQACHIELDLLSEPIGKQDQYIAAYGGLTCFQFLPNDQ